MLLLKDKPSLAGSYNHFVIVSTRLFHLLPDAMVPAISDTASLPQDHTLILFDGVCNLCNSSVNFIIDRDPDGYFKFAALQDEAAQPILARYGLSADYTDSIVLIEDGQCYRQSDAALRIARHLQGAWPLLYTFILLPRPLRDLVYDWIARNRYCWFGKRDTCRIPTPELRARFL